MSTLINPKTPREFLQAWLDGKIVQTKNNTYPCGSWAELLDCTEYVGIPVDLLPENWEKCEYRLKPKGEYVVKFTRKDASQYLLTPVFSSFKEAIDSAQDLDLHNDEFYTIHKLSESIEE